MDENTTEYSISWQGTVTGPYSIKEIRSMLKSGRINSLYRIKVEGEWLMLREFIANVEFAKKVKIQEANKFIEQMQKSEAEEILVKNTVLANSFDNESIKLNTHSEKIPPEIPAVNKNISIWNPSAAVNWSLLFTPIFGALIHANNWRSLNQKEEASKSMIWFYGSILFLFLHSIFLPSKTLLGLILLCLWYFLSAKKQIKYVKENKIEYEKKSWLKPLLFGIVVIILYIAIGFLILLGL